MPFNLLLLPLVGGYFFLDKWLLTQYYLSRITGNRLIIWSAVPATGLLLLSVGITHYGAVIFPKVALLWYKIIPFQYSGASFISLLLGLVLPIILNKFIDPIENTQKIIKERGSELDNFLNDAINESKQVSITLKNNKVYIGFITTVYLTVSMLEDRPKFIKLLPTLSGYRDERTKKLNLTTTYTAIYEELYDNEDFVVEDFQIVIPVSEIFTTNYFDLTAYQKFNELE